MELVNAIQKIKDIAPDIAMLHVECAENHKQPSRDLLLAHYESILDLIHLILLMTEKDNGTINTDTFLEALCADVRQNEKLEKQQAEQSQTEQTIKENQ